MYVWSCHGRPGMVTGTDVGGAARLVNGTDILLSTAAAAAVVVSGALYALFFALCRLQRLPWLNAAAWAAYAVLVVSTLLLALALALSGVWLAVVAVMLIGYWLAPRAIWRLSTATHAEEPGATHDASGS